MYNTHTQNTQGVELWDSLIIHTLGSLEVKLIIHTLRTWGKIGDGSIIHTPNQIIEFRSLHSAMIVLYLHTLHSSKIMHALSYSSIICTRGKLLHSKDKQSQAHCLCYEFGGGGEGLVWGKWGIIERWSQCQNYLVKPDLVLEF